MTPGERRTGAVLGALADLVADDAALEHLLARGDLIRVLRQDRPCHDSGQADRYPNSLKHSKRPISSTGLCAAAPQHIALPRPGKVQHDEGRSRAGGRRMRRRITTGSAFEEEFAYSRAVVCGEWCFVAGTTGYDYATMAMPERRARPGPGGLRHDRADARPRPASPWPTSCGCSTRSSTRAPQRDRACAARGAGRGPAGGDDGGGRPERAGDEDRDRGHRVPGVRFPGHRRGNNLRSRLDQGGVEVHHPRQREFS